MIRGEGDDCVVEVAHEALLRKWPVLQGWLKEDRLFLIWSESLSQELEQWKGAPLRYRPQSLLRGWQLQQAEQWFEERQDRLGAEARDYVGRSLLARFYGKLCFVALLLLVLPTVLATVAQKYGVEFSYEFDWLQDSLSRYLTAHVDLLRAVDQLLFAFLAMVLIASARRYFNNAYGAAATAAGPPHPPGTRSSNGVRGVAGALAGLLLALGVRGASAAELKQLPAWNALWVAQTFDSAQLRRGFKVYREVCGVCHSLKYIRFRNLSERGGPEFTNDQVQQIAADYKVTDGPNDQGEMFERPAAASDFHPGKLRQRASRTSQIGKCSRRSFAIRQRTGGRGGSLVPRSGGMAWRRGDRTVPGRCPSHPRRPDRAR